MEVLLQEIVGERIKDAFYKAKDTLIIEFESGKKNKDQSCDQ